MSLPDPSRLYGNAGVLSQLYSLLHEGRTATRETILEDYFQNIIRVKADFIKLCEDYPKGEVPHEHIAPHPEDALDVAIAKNLYWDRLSGVFVGEKNRIKISKLATTQFDDMRADFIRSCEASADKSHKPLGFDGASKLEEAIAKDLYWDKVQRTFEKQQNCIKAEKLKLPYYAAIKAQYDRMVTQPKIKEFEGSVVQAMKHFHRTFVTIESIDVPLSHLLAENYVTAKSENIQHLLLMVDVPYQTQLPMLSLPSTVEELTDEVLNDFFVSIQSNLKEEVFLVKKMFECAEGEATAEVRNHLRSTGEDDDIVDGIFSPDNPTTVSLQIEIGKAHSLKCRDADLGKLLARFAYDVARGMELEKICDFVLSINCVGPEHLTKKFEPQEVAILNFFHRRYRGRIALHAGELCHEIATKKDMRSTAANVEKSGAQRLGHAYCLTEESDHKILRDRKIAVEVCYTSTKRLFGTKHPFPCFNSKPHLYEHEILIVASTDDRYIFNTTQSIEFYKILKRIPNVNYRDLQALAYNSLLASDLPGSSILDLVDGRYIVKNEYKKYVEGGADLSCDYTQLTRRQKKQIQLVQAIAAFEDAILKKIAGSNGLSSSPPELSYFSGYIKSRI